MRKYQGWEFSLSFFCSKSLIINSDREWFALYKRATVTLYKRATVSKSLSSLFIKEQPWANRSRRSLKNSDMSDLFVIRGRIALKKRVICSNYFQFFFVFDGFSLLFPFLFPRVNHSFTLCSVTLFSKERFALIALSLTKKERFAQKNKMRIPNPGKYTQQWRHLCFPLREGIFNLFWHPRPCCNSPWCLFYLFKTWNRKIHPEIIVCKHTVYAFFVKKTKIFCVQARAAALSPAGAVFEATLTAGQLSCIGGSGG